MKVRVPLTLILALLVHAGLLGWAASPAADLQRPAGQGPAAGPDSGTLSTASPTPAAETITAALLPAVRLALPAGATIPVLNAAAAGTAGAGGGDSYLGTVRAYLNARAQQLGAGLGSRGVSEVRFAVAADGSTADVQLVRSSGSPTLDRTAVALVQRSSPLPAPPAPLRLRVPIEFR